ncbi:hypothetical protein [Paracholeplasma manati]|uniref:Uncharacterized protein n=1 Tax=Paracholeplasma manati TaxID=591373 RepID=A0ABT2Y5E5_9MOLU|nr:hypothetical protein [Paracholeplasma manati]MCV2231970.1 hypothetical protein [Paracholeplasma manati]MDG0888877.1 hypothetical protein [Paracholeplasma manati]
MGYWKSRNINAFVFLFGLLIISLSVFLVNVFRLSGFISVIPIFGFILIVGSLLHLIVTRKSMIGESSLYMKSKGINYIPAIQSRITLNRGKWVLYLVGFVFTIISLIAIRFDSLLITIILIFLYVLYCILVSILDSKSVTKKEKIMVFLSIPIYLFVVFSSNMRIPSGIAMSWVMASVILVILTYIKIYKSDNKEHLSRLIPIFGGYIAYLSIIQDDYYVFNHVGITAFVCSVVLVVAIIVLYFLYKKQPALITPTGYFVSITIFPLIIGLAVSFAFLQLNYSFDFSQQTTDIVDILGKDTYIYDGDENFYFTYDFYERDRVFITEEEYANIIVGDTFEMRYYNGLFGIKYYIYKENQYIVDRDH